MLKKYFCLLMLLLPLKVSGMDFDNYYSASVEFSNQIIKTHHDADNYAYSVSNKAGFKYLKHDADYRYDIGYTPVTNEEYNLFVKATGSVAPKNWVNGAIPKNKEKHPVTNISYNDAIAYCNWLSKKENRVNYTLPTEDEWMKAAGIMPELASFNSGKSGGTTPVNKFSSTFSRSGAIDMWGNVWEWTLNNGTSAILKGGSYKTERRECDTFKGKLSLEKTAALDDVGFRVLRIEKRP